MKFLLKIEQFQLETLSTERRCESRQGRFFECCLNRKDKVMDNIRNGCSVLFYIEGKIAYEVSEATLGL